MGKGLDPPPTHTSCTSTCGRQKGLGHDCGESRNGPPRIAGHLNHLRPEDDSLLAIMSTHGVGKIV